MTKTYFGLFAFLLIITACSGPKKEPVSKKHVDTPATEVSGAPKDSVGILKWETDICWFEYTYNKNRYSEAELKGTLELLNMVGGLQLDVNATAFNPDQIEGLDTLEELDSEYRKKKKALKSLKIVNHPFWIGVKQTMLREMKDEYDLVRIGMQAYTNPDVLKGNRFSDVCPELVAALTDKDTTQLMVEWKKLVLEQCNKNGYPESLMKRYRDAYDSPDRIMQARTYLITFGWHNRVNKTLPNLRHDEKLNNKFDELFLKTDFECDEC